MSKRVAEGPHIQREHLDEMNGMPGTPEDKPQRATAAQMASRKIKDIRNPKRRMRSATPTSGDNAPAAPGGAFSSLSSGFSFGQNQSQSFPGASSAAPNQQGFSFNTGFGTDNNPFAASSFGATPSAPAFGAASSTPTFGASSPAPAFGGFGAGSTSFSSQPNEQPGGSMFASQPAQPAPSNAFGSTNIFSSQPTEQPVSNIFGGKPADTPATSNAFAPKTESAPSNPFGSIFSQKPAEQPAANNVFAPKPAESNTSNAFGSVFASQPAEQSGTTSVFAPKAPEEAPANPFGSIFSKPAEQQATSNGFATKPAEPASSNPFGSLFSPKPAEQPATSSIFGSNATESPATSNGFASKPTEESRPTSSSPKPTEPSTTNIFAPKAAETADRATSNPPAPIGLFSPKPAEQPATTSIFAPKAAEKTAESAQSNSFGSTNLFAPKTAEQEEPVASNPPTAAGLFSSKPTPPATTNLFAPKPAESASTKPAESASNSFGSMFSPKPAEKADASSIFAAKPAESTPQKSAEPATSNLFGPKPATPSTSTLFAPKPAEDAPSNSLGSMFSPKPAEKAETSNALVSKSATFGPNDEPSEFITSIDIDCPVPEFDRTKYSQEVIDEAELLWKVRSLDIAFQEKIAEGEPGEVLFDDIILFYLDVRKALGFPVQRADQPRPKYVPPRKAPKAPKATEVNGTEGSATANLFAKSFSSPASSAPKTDMFASQTSGSTPASSAPKTNMFASQTSSSTPASVPKFGVAPPATDFMAQFAKTVADSEAKEKAKRKAEEFDSDEDDEAEWERKDAEKQEEKRRNLEKSMKKRSVFVPGEGFKMVDVDDDAKPAPASFTLPPTVAATPSPAAASTPVASSPAAASPAPQTDADDENSAGAVFSLADNAGGEEGEESVFKSQARAFKLAKGKGWETQGTGVMNLFVNKEQRARIVLRADPSGSVILNSLLKKEHDYSKVANSVQFFAPNSEGTMEQWAVRVKKETIQAFFDKVEAIKY